MSRNASTPNASTPNASSRPSVIPPIVPSISNNALSHTDGSCSLPHRVKLGRFHVFQRNYQCCLDLQRLEAEHGFQVFQCVILPLFESSALDEFIELLLTNWFQLRQCHFRWCSCVHLPVYSHHCGG